MRSIDDLEVHGRRVLVRVDFNVPLSVDDAGAPSVADDTRMVAALPTIEELRARGARARAGLPPRPSRGSSRSAPVDGARRGAAARADRRAGHARAGGRRRQVRALSLGLADGEILLLENVRYEPGEERNDPELAHELAELADLYVNDAFGAAHRAHASTEGVAHLLPAAAGRLLEREVSTLQRILEAPARPLAAIVGGAKVKDKIAVIDRFLEIADVLVIGGAMASRSFTPRGTTSGASLCDEEDTEHARLALAQAAQSGHARVELPVDLVIGRALDEHAEHRVLTASRSPRAGWGSTSAPGPRNATRRDRDRRDDLLERADGRVRVEPYAAGTRASRTRWPQLTV